MFQKGGVTMVSHHINHAVAIAINLYHEYNHFRRYALCFYPLIINIACSLSLVIIPKIGHTCKAIYNRLVAKGKRKTNLALMVVCNKRLKQAFAIAKSGLTYDNKDRSTIVKP